MERPGRPLPPGHVGSVAHVDDGAVLHELVDLTVLECKSRRMGLWEDTELWGARALDVRLLLVCTCTRSPEVLAIVGRCTECCSASAVLPFLVRAQQPRWNRNFMRAGWL